MNNQTEARLCQVERASRVLRGACTGLFIAVTALAIVGTVSAVAGWTKHVSYYSQTFDIGGLGLGPRIVVALLGLLTAGIYLKALYHLRRLSTNYTRREIFTLDSARQIRQFGVSCILLGVVKMVWSFLPLAFSSNAPGPVGLTIDSILIGAAIVGISWFAEMAATLREENELTI